MNKVIVIEPNMNSFPHSEVNAGLLYVIEKTTSGDKIFISSQKHYDETNKIYDLKNWKKRFIKVPTFNVKIIVLLDLLLLLRILKIVFTLKKEDQLFLLGSYPITLFFISLINFLLKKKINIVLHGQMEAFISKNKIGYVGNYWKWVRFIFKMNDNIRYIILGKSIANNLNFLFKEKSKIIIIDQPYFYKINFGIKSRGDVLNLGFLGRFDKSKNIQYFYRLLDIIQPLIEDGLVRVSIIGKIEGEIEEKYINLVNFKNKSIDNNEFEKLALAQDFVLSFTDRNFYKATPSGVFFDCIKYSKPLIAFPNDFICYYFNQYAQLGFVCETVEDMSKQIVLLLNNKNVNFNDNFRQIRESLSVDNISAEFKLQL